MSRAGPSSDAPAGQVLAAEREHLELSRRCLVTMRAAADRIADYGVDELASHALGRLRADRIRSLDADPDAPPFFGRTDRDNESARVETFYIGRRHVRDESGDPVVIDWRAPSRRRSTAPPRTTGRACGCGGVSGSPVGG